MFINFLPHDYFISHEAKYSSQALFVGKEKWPSGAGAVGGFFAEGPPSARKWFFFNLFAEGRPSANKFFYFFLKKPLPRASSLALGKEIFRIFLKILCRGPALGKEMVF